MASTPLIGIRRDLPVRLGMSLRPQILTVNLRSGNPIDSTGGSVVGAIYKGEADLLPIANPSAQFTATKLANAKWRIELTRDAVLALAGLVPLIAVPMGTPLRGSQFMRRAFYTWAYQDALGQRDPLYYGALTILSGASGV